MGPGWGAGLRGAGVLRMAVHCTALRCLHMPCAGGLVVLVSL